MKNFPAPPLPVWLRGTASLAAILALALWLPLAVGLGLQLRAAAAVALLSSLAALTGRCGSALLRLPAATACSWALELVVGLTAVSLTLLATIATLQLAPLAALGVTTTLVLLLAGYTHRRVAGRAVPAASTAPLGADLALLLVLSLLVTLWSRQALTSVRVAEQTGFFPAWSDISAHATEINYLRHYPDFHGTSLYLAGEPSLFYHRASYAIPTVVAEFGGLTNLQAATAFWTPLGLLFMGLGTCALGGALGGRAGGCAAALALLLLPDASSYGWHNGIFDFHWIVGVSPGLGFGTAIVFTGLALLVTGCLHARPGLVWAGTAFAATAAAYKVQVAAPAALLFFGLLLKLWQPARPWHRPALLAALGAVGVALIFLFERIQLAPHFLTGHYESRRFLQLMQENAPPDSVALYHQFIASVHPKMHQVIGLGLLVVAAFGALTPAFVALLVWRRDPARPRLLRALPLLVLLAYFVTLFFVPTAGFDDLTEFRHRPFVLVYASLVVGVATESTLLFAALGPWRRRWIGAAGLLAAALVFGLLRADWAASANLQQSKMPWGAAETHAPIPADLAAATRFLREHGGRTDVVAAADFDARGLIGALTERPSYLAFGKQHRALGGHLRDVEAGHRATLERLAQAATFADARRLARAAGIRWLVLRPGEFPAWSAAMLGQAAFTRGGHRVFDFGG